MKAASLVQVDVRFSEGKFIFTLKHRWGSVNYLHVNEFGTILNFPINP